MLNFFITSFFTLFLAGTFLFAPNNDPIPPHILDNLTYYEEEETEEATERASENLDENLENQLLNLKQAAESYLPNLSAKFKHLNERHQNPVRVIHAFGYQVQNLVNSNFNNPEAIRKINHLMLGKNINEGLTTPTEEEYERLKEFVEEQNLRNACYVLNDLSNALQYFHPSIIFEDLSPQDIQFLFGLKEFIQMAQNALTRLDNRLRIQEAQDLERALTESMNYPQPAPPAIGIESMTTHCRKRPREGCLICTEKNVVFRKLSCCKTRSDVKKICKKCVKKVNSCPFCKCTPEQFLERTQPTKKAQNNDSSIEVETVPSPTEPFEPVSPFDYESES